MGIIIITVTIFIQTDGSLQLKKKADGSMDIVSLAEI